MSELSSYFETQFTDFRLKLNEAEARFNNRLLFSKLTISAVSGDLLWIVGDNGIGKTTLLKLIAGLISFMPDAINWQVGDTALRPEDCLSYQSHHGHTKAGLTLAEDFQFWGKMVTGHVPGISALNAVGLSEALNTKTQHLSAGQRRRLSLARLLIGSRPIWIMDEPMAGLDGTGRALVTDIVTTHLARGGIAVISSHNPSDIPANRVMRLTLGALT